MYLVDSFIPAMTYVVETIEKIGEDGELEYNRFRQRVIGLLTDNAIRVSEGGYAHADYDNALFAVSAFIDEKVMNSHWNHKDQWGAELLQRHYFNTTKAGVDFFSRLDALNPFSPIDRDIREVYYYCLALGFAGQYYRPGDKAHLAEILKANAEILCASINTDYLLNAQAEAAATDALPRPRMSFPRTPFLIGLPVLFLVGLFMFLRHGILSAVNDLLMII